jgi:hypothetical protein
MTSRAQLRALVLQVLQSGVIERKTLAQYLRQLRQYARDYFTQKIDDTGFLDKMLTSITSQINRAWNEGMRANGLDPAKDKTDEMRNRVDELVRNEQDHITNLADLINQQRANGVDDMIAINARVDVWANRYTDVVNTAKAETAPPDDLLEWVYGDTVHCETCAALNGTVLTAEEWKQGDYHPQQPPNEKLDCGGWRCKCKLVKTKKKRTGLPKGL